MPKTLTATRETIYIRRGVAGLVSTWLPVAIGLTAIAVESTQHLSSGSTSSFLRPIFAFLFGPMTDAHWDALHHLIRKCGHFSGYGTLGLLWLRAWLRTFHTRLQWTQAQWRRYSAWLALFCTFLTASADEYHQTFVPGRTGQFSDVLLDTSGAVLFTLILATLWRRQSRRA